MSVVKKQAKRLIDKLPEKATWDDIIYEMYVKMKISNALKSAKNGKVISHQEVKNWIFITG